MKKSKFIELIAKKNDLNKKAAEKLYNSMFEMLVESIMANKGHSISGFGSFTVAQRTKRKGINLHTGKAMTIPAKKVLKFKVSKNLKEKIAKL